MSLADIKEKAMHLPPKEKAELVHALLLSLDDDQWLDEVGRRTKEIADRQVELIPGERVLEKARALLSA